MKLVRQSCERERVVAGGNPRFEYRDISRVLQCRYFWLGGMFYGLSQRLLGFDVRFRLWWASISIWSVAVGGLAVALDSY